MKSPSRTLAMALDAEFKRVAEEEDMPMSDLVAEVANLLGCSERQIYNWRSGKWSLPLDYVPQLRRRFNSTHLLGVLGEALKDMANPLSEDVNPAQIKALAKDLVLTSLTHYQLIEEVLKKAELSKNDVGQVEESNALVASRFNRVLSMLEALYEQESALRRKQA